MDISEQIVLTLSARSVLLSGSARWIFSQGENVQDPAALPHALSSGGKQVLRAPLEIALAEDNPGDVFLVREALLDNGLKANLTVREDGEAMMQFINLVDSGDEPCPDIFLLDLNLPKRSGETLLKRIRESTLCATIPVIIVTSSDSPRDREISARLGASSYFRKPADFDEFLRLGAVIRQVIERSVV